MRFSPFGALLGLCLFLTAPSAAAQRQWIADGAIPLRYEISIVPDVGAATFAGEARIAVETSAPIASITLNAADLEVTAAAIDGAAARLAANAEAQTLTLTPRRSLRPGRHMISLVYSGKIYDEAYGLFRVSYQADGQTKRALATQFEPGDARRLAPMWDQPNRRAVFSVSVTAPSDQMAVSNMPVARTANAGAGMTRTTFADTPSMASYLLFLAVGDFERVTRDVDGVELGVVVRRGQTGRVNEALAAGEQSLRYFTEYFGIRYPLPKLDMIGVPGAGGFGAMENWGAILYFDQYLLVDANSSEAERQNVFSIVAHEIAHQWFGNLVTMDWWDDLWLNEGFASWMAAKATEAVHPDWRPWLAQMSDGTATAMALDARAGTHPIIQTVNTIDEANLAFDSITYEKGLAVIRMLEAYVGEEGFRRGVRDYLNAHAYGNARTEDLWSAVQAASGQPVLDIARGFTQQVGFPVLSVASADCAREPSNTRINIAQRRFALDSASRTEERWSIPVVARRLGAAPVEAVLPAAANAAIEVGPACGPYLVNAGQSGFFRVLYDRPNLSRLIAAMPTLAPEDQLGLLLDYWTFGRSGDAPFTDYLDLMSAAPPDAHPMVVSDTANSLLALANYSKDRPGREAVESFARRILAPHLARLGWDVRTGEAPGDTLLRSQLIGALGTLRDADVIAEARRRVRAAGSDASALPASIRNAIIGVYAYNADARDYEDMLSRARAANDFVDQRRLYVRLAGARDPALATRTLQLALREEIPRQLRTQVIAAAAGEHPRLGWDFLKDNRAAIEPLLDPLQRLEYPAAIAAGSADVSIAAELEAYARDFPPGARASVDSAIATIRLRGQTVSERMPAVEAWISARETQPAQRRRRAS
ncbi:MAG: M1 family metallopeptidase [Terricaulis sp.]